MCLMKRWLTSPVRRLSQGKADGQKKPPIRTRRRDNRQEPTTPLSGNAQTVHMHIHTNTHWIKAQNTYKLFFLFCRRRGRRMQCKAEGRRSQRKKATPLFHLPCRSSKTQTTQRFVLFKQYSDKQLDSELPFFPGTVTEGNSSRRKVNQDVINFSISYLSTAAA